MTNRQGDVIWYELMTSDPDAAAGGTLHMEPMEIPGGEFSLSAADPHGATFGLVGRRK